MTITMNQQSEATQNDAIIPGQLLSVAARCCALLYRCCALLGCPDEVELPAEGAGLTGEGFFLAEAEVLKGRFGRFINVYSSRLLVG